MSQWERVTDDEGRVYFYNSTTEETSWTNPEEEAGQNEWQVYHTEDGKEYYYNATSGETTWERPADMEEKGEGAGENKEMADMGEEGDDEKDELDIELETKPLASNELINPPQFGSFSEAENAFIALLKENKIDSTSSFQSVMARFIKNPVYWAIPDSLHRKKLYDDYLEAKFKEQIANKTETVKTFEKNFNEVLKEYHSIGKLDHRTRWITVKKLLIQDEHPIFKHSILTDDEIATKYYAYTATLHQEYEDELKKKKEEALHELEVYLTQTQNFFVSEKFDWEDLYEKLKSDTRFKANTHFTILEEHEILVLYQEKIYPQIIKKLKEELHRVEKSNYRNDRKARENFKKLLGTQNVEADTLFKDIFPFIENEDAFIELVGRNGSTPIELFFDIVDEKRQSIKLKRDMIENVLLDSKKKDPNSYNRDNILKTKESFVEWLSSLNDARLDAFDVSTSNADNLNTELSKIYNNMKRDHDIERRRRLQDYSKEATHLVNLFAEWLADNTPKLDNFKFAPDSSEADPAKVSIITSGDASTFSFPETLSPKDIFGSFPYYKKIENLVSLNADVVNESQEEEIKRITSDVLHSFVKIYHTNSRKQNERKRPRDDDSTSRESKKSKNDDESKERVESAKANPILLNY